MAHALLPTNIAPVYARAFKILTGFTIGGAVKKGNADLLHAIYDGLQAVQANGKQAATSAQYKIDTDMLVPAAIKTE